MDPEVAKLIRDDLQGAANAITRYSRAENRDQNVSDALNAMHGALNRFFAEIAEPTSPGTPG
ncbi:hypothetical protein ACPPVW_18410 [Leifsonia sp. McL0607]|uniref:hypothetical protein n=1 Tax=Leifsonia sp. McL0607 TaxID=3415672 RepID=UPI003CE84254